MRGLLASSVGDGQCLAFLLPNRYSLRVDCGSQQGRQHAWEGLERQIWHYPWLSGASFLLSHFHLDHYGGLLWGRKRIHKGLSKPLDIRKIYYPGIPNIRDTPEDGIALYRALFIINAYLFGDGSGSMAHDMTDVVSRISSVDFSFQPLFAGDVFFEGQSRFDVIWPPRVINSKETAKVVVRALEEYEKACHEIPELRELDEEVRRSGTVERLRESGRDRGLGVASDRVSSESDVDEDGELGETETLHAVPSVVKRANKALRDAANHLCVAFYCDTRLLFLGDLEPTGIQDALESMEEPAHRFYDILIAPHHGTHWHDRLLDVRADYVLASVGPKLEHKVDKKLALLGPVIPTHRSGDVHLLLARTRLLRDQFWDEYDGLL